MVPCVVGHFVALRRHALHDLRIGLNQASQHEKRGPHVLAPEDIEQLRCELRMRPVVEGQCDNLAAGVHRIEKRRAVPASAARRRMQGHAFACAGCGWSGCGVVSVGVGEITGRCRGGVGIGRGRHKICIARERGGRRLPAGGRGLGDRDFLRFRCCRGGKKERHDGSRARNPMHHDFYRPTERFWQPLPPAPVTLCLREVLRLLKLRQRSDPTA